MKNQFLLFYHYSVLFQNRMLEYKDIPMDLKHNENLKKIAEYNNFQRGLITEYFFKWALSNNIDYASIQWFIEIFSKQKDDSLKDLINAFYKNYKIYSDETNNCVKFRFKNEKGDINTQWYNDFVIAGVVYDKDLGLFDIDSLFDKLKLQKNIEKVKLGHLAKYNGEDKNRFLNILCSKKLKIVLETLCESKSIFIHWSTENLLYFSLVDIVDSILENNNYKISNKIKNIIYEYALENPDFLSSLSKYNYPNIKDADTESFCTYLLKCVEDIRKSQFVKNNDKELLIFEKEIKRNITSKNLIFLSDNNDKLLIETFVHNYAVRIANFPNSDLVFDQCSFIEENIENIVNGICCDKKPKYKFVNSKSSKWLQLSDIVAGITGAFMAYINTHDINKIKEDIKTLNEIQKANLKLFIQLRKKSVRKNIYFDHMSINYLQEERILFIQDRILK